MKIGILCSSSLNKFNQDVLFSIHNNFSDQISCCLIDERPEKTVLQRLKHHYKKGRRSFLIVLLLKRIFRPRKCTISTESFCTKLGIPLYRTIQPYAEETINYIKTNKIDILVYLSGFGLIVKKPLLDATPLGVLSYHHGNLREYRGQPAAFWELLNGELSMGATVQKINEWIDAGCAVAETTISIYPTDSYYQLKERLYLSSSTLMSDALRKFTLKNYEPKHLGYYGTLYSLPTLWDCVLLEYRIMIRRARSLFTIFLKMVSAYNNLVEIKLKQR